MPTLPNSLFDYSKAKQNPIDRVHGEIHNQEATRDELDRINVLVVGKLTEQEFPGIQSLLEFTADVVSLDASDNDATTAADRIREPNLGGRNFDLVLYIQPRQAVSLKAHQQIAQAIQDNSQVTCLIQLLGTWCEGEGRTGKVPEGWQRVFWHAWPRWWNRWLIENKDSKFANPFSLESQFQIVEAEGDHEMIDALHSALLQHGFFVRQCLPSQSPLTNKLIHGQVAGIWIGKQLNGPEAENLRQFCDRFRSCSLTGSHEGGAVLPVIALLDFPRRETAEAAQMVGATEVVGLPCDTADLVHALEQVMMKSLGKHKVITQLDQEEMGLQDQEIKAA